MQWCLAWSRSIEVVFLIGVAVWIGLWSPLSHGMNREEAVRYALQHNPALKAVKENVKAALQQWRGAEIFPNNPGLSVQGGVVSVDGTQGSPSLLGTRLFPTVTVGLSLALPVGGRWSRKKQAMKAWLEQAKAVVKVSLFQLQVKVHQSFQQLLIEKAKLRRLRTRLRLAKQLLKVTEKRWKLKLITRVSWQFAKLEYQHIQQILLQQQIQTRWARMTLLQVLGVPSAKDASTWAFRGKLTQTFAPLPSTVSLQAKALTHNPRLQVLKAAVEWSKRSVDLAHAQAVPDLTLSVSYMLDQGAHYIQGGLSMPLPMFQRNQAQRGVQSVRLQQARLRWLAAQFNVKQETARAAMQYRAQRRMLQLSLQRNKAMKEQALSIQKGLQAGTLHLTQALTMQRSLTRSTQQHLNVVQSMFAARIRLFKVMGVEP